MRTDTGVTLCLNFVHKHEEEFLSSYEIANESSKALN